ncbi:MAG: hypothetical protein RR348_04330 [Clostridia bacterium]
MLHKITLSENGIFEVKEIEVFNTKTKSGAESGTWKTSNGNMKVCAFEKVNYEPKSSIFVMHTTQEVKIAKQIILDEAIATLRGFLRGYKHQNQLDWRNIYKRTKCLNGANTNLKILEEINNKL